MAYSFARLHRRRGKVLGLRPGLDVNAVAAWHRDEDRSSATASRNERSVGCAVRAPAAIDLPR